MANFKKAIEHIICILRLITSFDPNLHASWKLPIKNNLTDTHHKLETWKYFITPAVFRNVRGVSYATLKDTHAFIHHYINKTQPGDQYEEKFLSTDWTHYDNEPELLRQRLTQYSYEYHPNIISINNHSYAQLEYLMFNPIYHLIALQQLIKCLFWTSVSWVQVRQSIVSRYYS